eukprot:gene432-514_t
MVPNVSWLMQDNECKDTIHTLLCNNKCSAKTTVMDQDFYPLHRLPFFLCLCQAIDCHRPPNRDQIESVPRDYKSVQTAQIWKANLVHTLLALEWMVKYLATNAILAKIHHHLPTARLPRALRNTKPVYVIATTLRVVNSISVKIPRIPRPLLPPASIDTAVATFHLIDQLCTALNKLKYKCVQRQPMFNQHILFLFWEGSCPSWGSIGTKSLNLGFLLESFVQGALCERALHLMGSDCPAVLPYPARSSFNNHFSLQF